MRLWRVLTFLVNFGAGKIIPYKALPEDNEDTKQEIKETELAIYKVAFDDF